MLSNLSIQNYAIIEQIDFRPGNGLNVITGETGAGKSILLGALGLILGNRADMGVLKKADKKCVIEAVFQIEAYNLRPFFEERDLDYYPELIVRREILPAGKSRAFINDTPARLSDLSDLASHLVDLHQQFSSLDIYQKNYQLELLDAMAENQKIKQNYQAAYSQWVKTGTELENLRITEREANKEFDFLQFQFSELEEAELEAGELEGLEDELSLLENFGDIKSALVKMVGVLEENQSSINEQLQELSREIGGLAQVNSSCKGLSDRLEAAYIELQDVAQEATSLNEDLEFDPDRMELLTNRLDNLYRLQKKHGLETVEELIDLKEELDQKLQEFGSLSDKIEKLEKRETELRKTAVEIAARLTESRKSAAQTIQKLCGKMLGELSMPHAVLNIELTGMDEPGSEGMDEVKFLFSANKGMEFKDLRRVASGGEVSRLNLAIKSIIAGKMHLPTLIFDEIDSGVSGDVALKMGRILQKTAENHQIIVITHSPQVAARGMKHFFIHKTTLKDSTQTQLKILEDQNRINHIAVMLSSDPPTAAAIENAKELINLN
nr:DNA repair protein RecN [Saprospiraceae bacterium]